MLKYHTKKAETLGRDGGVRKMEKDIWQNNWGETEGRDGVGETLGRDRGRETFGREAERAIGERRRERHLGERRREGDIGERRREIHWGETEETEGERHWGKTDGRHRGDRGERDGGRETLGVVISRSGRACVRHASADMKTTAWLEVIL